MRYEINAPFVIADNIEGEVIILNMQTGKYYSLLGSALKMWELLCNNATVEEIVDILSKHFDANSDVIRQEVEKLIAIFVENDLLRATSNENMTQVISFDGENITFEEPNVAIYTDLEELLLIDPIHEVDDMGWPQTKSE